MQPPDAETEGVACHVKGCGAPAVRSCDRCGHPFCADHVQPHTVERRVEQTDQSGLLLTRVPTRRETYFLCRLCVTKPVIGKHPPIPDLA